jgi:hypothetical protein
LCSMLLTFYGQQSEPCILPMLFQYTPASFAVFVLLIVAEQTVLHHHGKSSPPGLLFHQQLMPYSVYD